MQTAISGIHHITAIASDPQRNLDFYTRTLGLRLVKLTVNFDDPGTYHFYFADASGNPGTVLTFFPWPDARRGRHGVGQVGAVGFNIPPDSAGYWIERLKAENVSTGSPFRRFDEEVIPFIDPDGMQAELVASHRGKAEVTTWEKGPVPPEHAIRGFAAPALLVSEPQGTAALLSEVMGLRQIGESGNRLRFAGEAVIGGVVDVEARPGAARGGMGAGAVHHIAFRTPDDDQQLAWRETLITDGFEVTEVRDRNYFHSIYFREPGGILFEIATDAPGFTIDEPFDSLGTHLKLPAWFEPRRETLQEILPPLELPEAQRSGAD